MKVTFTNKTMGEIDAQFEVIFVVDKNLEHEFIADAETMARFEYKGEGNLLLLESRRLYVGIGKLSLEALRIGICKAYNALKGLNVANFKVATYLAGDEISTFMAYAEGAGLGSYEFDRYKSDKKPALLTEILVAKDEFSKKTVSAKKANLGLEYGAIMAECANFAKDIVNEIPEIYTPERMASDAQALAKSDKQIKCEIFDEKYLAKEKMNAFLAVNRASAHPPRLIHLSYKPKDAKRRIVFVGKGLTYDSGGLSLKPGDSMLTMKSDKSGATAAMAIIKGASALNLPFEIHAVMGATENMIGGNAYKPDDVLISRSGVTIEVRNTDAEGRLVLADCLSWAQELKPDLMIDMATLTGACVVGLGEYTSAIMGNSDELKNRFKALAKESGELFTPLDFNDHLRELVKSQIADVSNTASSRYGGALTAGIFLDKFVKDEYKDKWLHLDIAGPAYVQKAWGYNQYGASGAPVRACLYFLRALAKEM